ncbi:MAG: hypothetical protein LBT97_09760, partial [Planctomycetota bacterium]|nr:hypothetical protein [Planctomycetota bacterium]
MLPVSRLPAPAIILVLCAGLVAAGERIVSQSGLVDGVFERGGFSISPARDVAPEQYSDDPGPAQVFEILRPGQAPLRIGRLHTSCSCIELSAERRDFGRGERAFLRLRNVKPTVKGGATYSFFVQITEPARETLRYDVFVDSAAPGPLHGTPTPRERLRPPAPVPPAGAAASPWRADAPADPAAASVFAPRRNPPPPEPVSQS